VTFRINKDGRVSWVELTDAASDTEANLSAMDAVCSSSPFQALSGSDSVDVAAQFNSDLSPQFHFAYVRPSAADLESSKRLYSEAVSAQKEGNLEKAIQLMRQAHQLVPANVHIRDGLVDVYYKSSGSKPAQQAMSLLRQALLLDPLNQTIRQKLNALLAAAGKNAADFDTRLALARQYESACQYENALCEYGEAWLLKQDQSLVAEINTACRRRSNYADVRKWQDALKLADKADYHAELGRAYEGCDERQNAIAEYHAALKLEYANRLASSSLERLEHAEPIAAGDSAADAGAQLRDDFPYNKVGSCTVSVTTVKNRRVSVDYLKAACGARMTRWAENQTAFKFYVDDGKNVPGYRKEYRQIMIDAFATWVKASQNRLTYTVVDTPQDANVACYWVPECTKEMKKGELGVTKWTYMAHKKEPNLWMPQTAQVFIVTLAPNSRKSISDWAMKAICLHELGHMLGITGHSPYRGDVMYATLSPYDIPQGLSDHDIATIKRLYQGYTHLK
jgi:tetratricopeptide (TPR) repeat protein